jgi:hypothetical protein
MAPQDEAEQAEKVIIEYVSAPLPELEQEAEPEEETAGMG